MFSNHLKCIIISILVLSGNANATMGSEAPFSIIVQDLESNNDKEIAAKPTKSGYVYDFYDQGVATPVKGVVVQKNDLPAPIKNIALSQTTTIAISDEGPWQPLFSLDKNSSWTPIDYPKSANRFTLKLPDSDNAFSYQNLHASRAQIVQAAEKTDWGNDDGNRWISLAKKCDATLNDNPCYSYISKQKLRFTLTNDQVIFLIIEYPGGC